MSSAEVRSRLIAALEADLVGPFDPAGGEEVLLLPPSRWYLTGFLMEKPLGVLRDDLRALGFERDPNTKEPEDHVGAPSVGIVRTHSDAPIACVHRSSLLRALFT